MKRFSLVFLFLFMCSTAKAECMDEDIATRIERATVAWQAETGVFVHPSVLAELTIEVCTAVEELVNTTSHSRDAYVSNIEAVTAEFLSSNNNAVEVLSFSAMLLEAVSPGGFSFPSLTAWPTLVLEFNVEPESVVINDVRATSPLFTYNITIGKVELRATRTGSTDCVHSIVSQEGRNYRVRCDF